MNYTEIVDMALSYADREDDEVTTRMDQFMFITEARINKKLKVSGMSVIAKIDLSAVDPDQEIFGLPSDFGGLRSISIAGDFRRTLAYVNPEQFANRVNFGTTGSNREKIYYNIVAKELHLYPTQNTGFLEITYYQKADPLTAANPNNWISDDNPEAYIFGLLVEISAFAKDSEASGLWNGRFIDCIGDIQADDLETRWSGTSLQTHVG